MTVSSCMAALRPTPPVAASSSRNQPAGRFPLAPSSASRASRIATPLVLGLAILLVSWAQAAAGGGIYVFSEEFLRGSKPDSLIPFAKGYKGGVSELDPRHLTIGPFGDDNLYIAAEGIHSDRIPRVFGPALDLVPRSEPELTGHCYISTRTGDRTVAVFDEGMNFSLDTVAVFADKTMLEHPERCGASTRVHAGLSTQSGLRLGLTRKEVRTILGPPHGSDSKRFGYYSKCVSRTTPDVIRRLGWEEKPPEYYRRIQILVVWFKNGRVVGFQAEQFSNDTVPPSP